MNKKIKDNILGVYSHADRIGSVIIITKTKKNSVKIANKFIKKVKNRFDMKKIFIRDAGVILPKTNNKYFVKEFFL